MDIKEREYENVGLDSSGSRLEPAAGECEYGNEPSGSIKDGEFLDQLRGY
jgi:hypothetical protein